jgi:RNA polymerase sigma-B factor
MSATQSHERERRAREERALFERVARGGDPRARDELVGRFLPLARALALRYQHSHESLDDLMQVAALGLVKAIDGFDAEREIAFSSYAVPTILGELRRHFRDRTWAVRVPRNLQELSLRIDRTVEDLAEQLRRQPRVAEVAAALGVDEEELLEALQARGAYRALSFDAPRGSDEETATLADSIGVGEDGFERAEQRATLDALLGLVTPREREVLRLRFEDDMTQAEIGAIIGVSQMQISRIIRRALELLRAAGDRPVTSVTPPSMH